MQKQPIAALRISYPSDFQGWEKRDSWRVIGATCFLGGRLIVDGWRREDGTLQTFDNGDLRLINGFGLLRQRAAPLMVSHIFDVDSTYGGVQSTHCHMLLTSAYLQETKVCKPMGLKMGFKLLHSWKVRINQWTTKYGLCEACAKALEERSTAERRALWDVLATMFRLKLDGVAAALQTTW